MTGRQAPVSGKVRNFMFVQELAESSQNLLVLGASAADEDQEDGNDEDSDREGDTSSSAVVNYD